VNVSSFIANRIAFNQEKSFSRFIIRLSLIATIISVVVMIVTLSFVNGFKEKVSEKVFSFWGHIRVSYRQPIKASIAEEIAIHKNDTVYQNIKNLPLVQSIHPFATKNAILKSTDELEGILLKGLDRTYNFQHLKEFLKEGRWVNFNDSTYAREIVISEYTAAQLKLKLNDKVLIYFFKNDQTIRPDKLTIVGIYKTGIEEYDKTFAIGDMKLIQRLNGWQPDEIGGYEIFLKDYEQMDDVSQVIYNQQGFPELWETRTIKEIYPNIFDWLNVIGNNGSILLIIMVVIAGINFISCLIILVLERVRMIGVLKAIGASDWMIQRIFLYQSAIITVVGIIAGILIALGLLWLQMKTGFVRLKEAEYYMSTAHVKIIWWQVAAVAAGTLLLSLLVLLIPSLIVRKIQPIKAIHFR
jgi:lipoprotein-releasing system permease protein